MERELRIHEMSKAANPTSLAHSRFLPEHLPQEYAPTGARRAISLKAVRHGNDDLWSFVMLPNALAVSRSSFPSHSLATYQRGFDSRFQQRVTVDTAHSDPPTPRAQAAACAAQRRVQEQAARKKERRIGWQEHREQRDEEYRLREQHGLLSPRRLRRTRCQYRRKKRSVTGGRPPLRGGIPLPPH
jgi:hypothetical protein